MAKPKLALIPASQGSKVFSVLPSDGSGDFDFSRSGSATRINSQGLIETVSSGQSRLNYPMIDGVVSGCPSLLLEPQRTNLVTYSEDFSNGYWIKSRSSITSTSTINPSGSVSSSYMYDDNTNGSHKIYSGTFSVTSGQNQSVSIFAKVGTLSTFKIIVARFDEVDIGFSEVIFDLENGTTSSVEGTIIDYGNGWYRCIVTDAVNYTGLARVFLYLKDGIYTGTGTDYIEIWGVQTETNSSYPTSYIPTNGSAVTRLAEAANGAGNADTFNDSEGVLMAEISALADDLTERRISLNDGSTSNIIRLGYNNNSNTILIAVYDGSNQVILSHQLTDTTNNNKFAFKYKQNDYALWVNGIEFGTSTSSFVFPNGTLTNLSFNRGDNNVNVNFYGNTKQLQYHNSALTDSELEQLTSWTSFSDMANGQLYTIE